MAAFYSCTGLTSINLPNSVTSIGNFAFFCCSSLTDLIIPNSVTSIGECAFGDCSGLTDLIIPNSVTTIGMYAFQGCSGLTSIIVENGNPNYDSRDNCNALIETASNTLLVGCQNTIIHNTITAIGASAFVSCTGLTHITIPRTVITIGASAFEACSGLTSIIVEDGNPNYDSRDNCNALIETTSNTLLAGCQNTIIPNTVTSIGNYAFYECFGLTSVDIPNSVTSIGNYAFGKCTGLVDVFCHIVNPSQVSLGYCVFYLDGDNYSGRTLHVPNQSSIHWYQEDTSWSQYFESIVESYFEVNGIYYRRLSGSEVAVASSPYNNEYSGQIIIPETMTFEGRTFVVTAINKSAFYGCGGLTSVNIPNSVTSIGDYAFEDCISLSNITVASDNPVYDSRENCNAIIETASNTLIAGCNNTVIPHGIITIGYGAFRGSGITSIVIPGSVHTIGEKAFMGCESLTDVALSEGLLLIDEEAFCGTGITEIQLPESLVRIGEQAFEETPLKSITLPKNVAFLGNEEDYEDDLYGGVFDYCYSLTEVNVDRLNTTYASSDGMLLTKDMKILLYYPQGRIGQCIIPNTVTTIYGEVFSWYSGLTSVTIPNSVTSIDDWGFYGCSALTQVKSLALMPPAVGYYTFDSDCYATAVLEVPESAVDDYRNHEHWGRFQNIQTIAVAAGDVDGDGMVTIGDVANLIDMLLRGGASIDDHAGADVDVDGVITIADVSAIIDMLLRH